MSFCNQAICKHHRGIFFAKMLYSHIVAVILNTKLQTCLFWKYFYIILQWWLLSLTFLINKCVLKNLSFWRDFDPYLIFWCLLSGLFFVYGKLILPTRYKTNLANDLFFSLILKIDDALFCFVLFCTLFSWCILVTPHPYEVLLTYPFSQSSEAYM